MRFVSFSALALSSSLAVLGCSSADESPKPAPSEPPPGNTPPAAVGPLFEKTACRFAVPTSLEGKQYDCYDLHVPENRSVEGSRTIKVHTIVFKGKPGGTPTIELNGGPGGPSEDTAVMLALGEGEPKETVGRFLEVGDYVLVDQRGTGRSIPRLTCQQGELESGLGTGPGKCAKRYADQGVDLTGYVTRENAADVHDLKLALKAPKVNLHAISYGTRLALEVLRHHEGDVAATIIDGVMPAQAKALSEGTLNFDQLLTKIFAECAADTKCNTTYPNLEQALSDVKAKLDATPFTLPGDSYPYDWFAFWGELSQGLYGDGMAGTVPQRIVDMRDMTQERFAAEMQSVFAEEEKYYSELDARLGQTELGREVIERRRNDPDPEAGGMADGMYLSVVCSDYAQYESVDEALALDAQVRPELRDPMITRETFESCNSWPKRPKADDVFAAVSSDRPVLAVGGAFDPATPVKWRDLAAETLGKVTKATMAAGAHGALDPCAMGFKMAFLNAPDSAVDVACGAAQKIEFTYAPMPQFHRTAKPRRGIVAKPVRVMPISPIALATRWRSR